MNEQPIPTPPASTKPLWHSKTFWLNIIAILAAFLPPVREWLASNPVEPIAVLAALNVLVRFVTRDKVSIFPAESDGRGGHGGDGGAGASLPLIAALACVVALCFANVGCEVLEASTFSVQTDEGRIGYSPKGGLEVVVEARGGK